MELSFFRPVAFLNEEKDVRLVQHSVSRRIFVQKKLEVYDREVFQYMKDHPVPDTPRIYVLAEEDSRLIVIEEYINGRSLQEILDEQGVLPRGSAREIMVKLCRILCDLHSADPPIIHRDIKPSNVLIQDDGRVVLIDMNAAKKFRTGHARDTRLIGTHGYAAPEQYGFGASDVRTDIYALGVLMNVMLTGCLPSETMADGPEGQWIEGCVKMDPEDRFSSMEEVLQALEPEQGEKIPKSAGTEEYLKSWLPPGFRTRAPEKIIPAAIGYLFLFAPFLSSNYGDSRLAVWIYRIFFLAAFGSAVFVSGNYRNVLGKMHISYIEKKPLRWFVIFLLDMGIIFTWVIVAILIESYLPLLFAAG